MQGAAGEVNHLGAIPPRFPPASMVEVTGTVPCSECSASTRAMRSLSGQGHVMVRVCAFFENFARALSISTLSHDGNLILA